MKLLGPEKAVHLPTGFIAGRYDVKQLLKGAAKFAASADNKMRGNGILLNCWALAAAHYAREGRTGAAEQLWKKAARLDPTPLKAVYYLALRRSREEEQRPPPPGQAEPRKTNDGQ